MQAAEPKSLESLLERSIAEHEEMVGMLEKLQEQLASDSIDSMQEFNGSFMGLREKSEQTDGQINEQLKLVDLSAAGLDQLLEKRKSLQEQIVQMIQQSVQRAGSVKSLLASEMQSLKTGRRALQGYKNVGTRQGKIINSKR